MKNIFLLLIICLSICSCKDKEIEFTGDEAKTLLVLSSNFSTDSIIKIHVSKSYSVIKSKPKNDINDSNTTITLKDAKGNLIPLSYSEKSNAFVSTEKPKQGQKFTIEASSKGVDSASASVEIPEEVAIQNVAMSAGSSDDYSDRTEIKISFIDPKENNYYKLTLYKKSELVSGGYLAVEYKSKDQIFRSSYSGIGNIREDEEIKVGVFNDEMFSGKEKSISINCASYDLNFSFDKVYIKLETISKDYFLFLKSFSQYLETDDSPFTEPVQIWSNVINGAGIVGASTPFIVEIKEK
ncbi:DUF4249 domain-containing protein [Marinilabiliaceae bacterium JC040]|nr:DUF4249 domain-containing protein [Marinilabiliaceae bacterium JC040]